jgi:hypothetical protein
MFRSNQRHLQPALISNVNELPEKRRRRLDESWAGTFRRGFFSRLKEDAFGMLFSDIPSRPNMPANFLVSLDTLKAGYGWSDEGLYGLQVRYAVGYENLAEGDFELRTLYNFRRRLSQYNVEHGSNLLAIAFVDTTDQPIKPTSKNHNGTAAAARRPRQTATCAPRLRPPSAQSSIPSRPASYLCAACSV